MIFFREFRKHLFCKILTALIMANFMIPSAAYAQMGFLNLPQVGTMIQPSGAFYPAIIKGLTVDPQNPLHFDFIVEPGQSGLEGDALKQESEKLIKYFLASLTVPKDELWVNLSPYEKDRIITEKFGQTEMGRDLLAQDYLLKQLTASLMYPESELGAKFWEKVYKQAREQYGVTEIPVNTFSKVWIVPQSAKVYVNNYSAFVVNSHLSVMLEEDYLSTKVAEQQSNQEGNGDSVTRLQREQASDVTMSLIKEVIIPAIEKEVNEGTHFANLRQIYNSMILAVWYRQALKETLLGQLYADQGKIAGVDHHDPQAKEKIYQQYVETFEKGVFDYIREDYDLVTQQMMPRKYISGGAIAPDEADLAQIGQIGRASDLADLSLQEREQLPNKSVFIVETNFDSAELVHDGETPFKVVKRQIEELSNLRRRIPTSLNEGDFDISRQARYEYQAEISKLLSEKKDQELTPELLKKAASNAIGNQTENFEANIGFYPGTMNPITYTHVIDSLAAILSENLNGLVMAPGWKVPDYEFVLSADMRLKMASSAISALGLQENIKITNLRKHMNDVFGQEKVDLEPRNDFLKREIMDIAAFIWLFTRYPKVQWKYIVGADKFVNYGSEQQLISTLMSFNNVEIVYLPREKTPVSPKKHIERYPWIKQGFNEEKIRVANLLPNQLIPFGAYENLIGCKELSLIANNLINSDVLRDYLPTDLFTKEFEGKKIDLTEYVPADVLNYMGNNLQLQLVFYLKNQFNRIHSILSSDDSGRVLKVKSMVEKVLSVLDANRERYSDEPQSTDQILINKKTDELRDLLADIQSAEKLLGKIRAGQLTESDINETSSNVMAFLLRMLPLYEIRIPQKFLLFSAPPATGKGAITDRITKKGAPYADLFTKLKLFHSRQPRNGEVIDVDYYFSFENVGDVNKNRILVLRKKDKLIAFFVNKQIQGVAKEGFREIRKLSPGDSYNLLPGDRVITNPEKINGRIIYVEEMASELSLAAPLKIKKEVTEETWVVRSIEGLSDVVGKSKLTFVEGGYDVFEKISSQYSDIFTIFISSLDDKAIDLRGQNQRKISQQYKNNQLLSLVAATFLNQLMQQQGDINLKNSPRRWEDVTRFVDNFRAFIAEGKYLEAIRSIKREKDVDGQIILNIKKEKKRQNQDFDPIFEQNHITAQNREQVAKEIVEGWKHTAQIIESEKFIDDINWTLSKFFNSSQRVELDSDVRYQMISLAYDIQLNLAGDLKRGDNAPYLKRSQFYDQKPTPEEFQKKEENLTDDNFEARDMYNRVVEGVIQTLLRYDYSPRNDENPEKKRGHVLLNARLVNPTNEELERHLDGVSEEFIGSYFKYLVTHINEYYARITNQNIPDEGDNKTQDVDLAQIKDVGGIDLNADLLDLELEYGKNGILVPANPAQLESIRINGLVPIIINIRPIANLPMLIGFDRSEPEGEGGGNAPDNNGQLSWQMLIPDKISYVTA